MLGGGEILISLRLQINSFSLDTFSVYENQSVLEVSSEDPLRLIGSVIS